jgi:hypothetical protein
LSAAGFLGFGFIGGIASFSLANFATTPPLSQYVGEICATLLRSSPTVEVPFLSESVDAMKKMMIDMEIRPVGDVDRDFVTSAGLGPIAHPTLTGERTGASAHPLNEEAKMTRSLGLPSLIVAR